MNMTCSWDLEAALLSVGTYVEASLYFLWLCRSGAYRGSERTVWHQKAFIEYRILYLLGPGSSVPDPIMTADTSSGSAKSLPDTPIAFQLSRAESAHVGVTKFV